MWLKEMDIGIKINSLCIELDETVNSFIKPNVHHSILIMPKIKYQIQKIIRKRKKEEKEEREEEFELYKKI